MILFRPASIKDLDNIHRLSMQSGIGLTTLPKDKSILETRIRWSEESFKKNISAPLDEYYLFVLEDRKTNALVGTSAIESNVGYKTPFYSYKLSKMTRMSHKLNIRADFDVLNLVNDKQGTSEICTLYLHPEYRHNKNGLMLSKSRFLFMADMPGRFSSQIIAEMRGVSSKSGDSPFYNALAKHFFKMPFDEADRLSISTNKQFIADLMPRSAIYVRLLSKEAQAVIGSPHPSTIPAMNILLKEGFRFNQYIDIFDGGPTLDAEMNLIHSIHHSNLFKVHEIDTKLNNMPVLVSNAKINFKASIGSVITDNESSLCTISKQLADTLEISINDEVRVLPLGLKTWNK